MDRVFINDLRIDTIIGIYDWEREVHQTVSLDIEMAHDNIKAAQTDDIQHALNYKAVAKALITQIENSQCLLVERLAEEAAQMIRQQFNVPWLRLTLKKPGALRGSKDVGVTIERGELPNTHYPSSHLMATVYLGLGSNIRPTHYINNALTALKAQYGTLSISPFYQSTAVGFEGDDFINLVVRITTRHTVGELLKFLKQLENKNGRDRNAPRYSGRTLDIDILTYNDLTGIVEGVMLPRDEIFKHAFVLKPLQDLAPELIIPGTTQTAADLWQAFDATDQTIKKVTFDLQ